MTDEFEYKGYKIFVEQEEHPVNPMEDWDWENGTHFVTEGSVNLSGDEIPTVESEFEPWNVGVYGGCEALAIDKGYASWDEYEFTCSQYGVDTEESGSLQDCVNCYLKHRCDALSDWRTDNLDFWSEKKALIDFLETHTVLRVFKYEHSGVAYNTSGFSCPWDSGQVGYISAPNTLDVPDVEKYLEGIVETFSNWACGNVWGYRVEDKDGEEIASCWGFFGEYGMDEWQRMFEEAKSEIDVAFVEMWADRKKIVSEYGGVSP